MTTWAGFMTQLIIPTPDSYAHAATGCIGHGLPVCIPNLGHRLQMCLYQLLPDSIRVGLCVHESLHHRALNLISSSPRVMPRAFPWDISEIDSLRELMGTLDWQLSVFSLWHFPHILCGVIGGGRGMVKTTYFQLGVGCAHVRHLPKWTGPVCGRPQGLAMETKNKRLVRFLCIEGSSASSARLPLPHTPQPPPPLSPLSACLPLAQEDPRVARAVATLYLSLTHDMTRAVAGLPILFPCWPGNELRCLYVLGRQRRLRRYLWRPSAPSPR
ncbi:hypothetical protein CFC21_107275 [Triticum aestivum]|uniref:Uncharacterized protein n=2 Tax=Triticum aestivum TaxID=4565 RepID=A0A9R1MGG2_WHEAT|nr:hypothetical protein CFC21_107275 [Triticum aestivum]